MQLVKHDGIETVITLSERNIRELYAHLDNPDFNGLRKLQVSDNLALDQRIVSLLIER